MKKNIKQKSKNPKNKNKQKQKQKQSVNVKVNIDQSKRTVSRPNRSTQPSQSPVIISSNSPAPYPYPMYQNNNPYGLSDIQNTIRSTIADFLPSNKGYTVGNEMKNPYNFGNFESSRSNNDSFSDLHNFSTRSNNNVDDNISQLSYETKGEWSLDNSSGEGMKVNPITIVKSFNNPNYMATTLPRTEPMFSLPLPTTNTEMNDPLIRNYPNPDELMREFEDELANNSISTGRTYPNPDKLMNELDDEIANTSFFPSERITNDGDVVIGQTPIAMLFNPSSFTLRKTQAKETLEKLNKDLAKMDKSHEEFKERHENMTMARNSQDANYIENQKEANVRNEVFGVLDNMANKVSNRKSIDDYDIHELRRKWQANKQPGDKFNRRWTKIDLYNGLDDRGLV